MLKRIKKLHLFTFTSVCPSPVINISDYTLALDNQNDSSEDATSKTSCTAIVLLAAILVPCDPPQDTPLIVFDVPLLDCMNDLGLICIDNASTLPFHSICTILAAMCICCYIARINK